MPRHALSFAALLLAAMPAYSASLQDAQGLWLSADKAAVIEFKACADTPAALCGQIVWDKDAGTPDDTCGMRIAKLQKFDGNAWRDGWVHDPRDKKNYKGAVRVKDNGNVLSVRAYIGTEMLGQTEEMTRTDKVPDGCKAH